MTAGSIPSRSLQAQEAQLRRIQATRILGRVVTYLVLAVGGMMFAIPFLWMVRTSLLREDLLFAEPPVWIPWPPQWSNYQEMWSTGPFLDWLRNSVLVTFFGVLGNTISCTLAAYGFARGRFPGRDKLFVAVLGTLMIPFHVILIPQYLLFKQLGWLNTLYCLIVPSLFGGAFGIFILRQFFLSLPRELDEAAEMDGAGRWDILWRIIIPLSKPAIATVAVFTFIDQWNEFVRPLVFLQTPENYTLAVGIRWFTGRYQTLFHLLMAGAVVMLAPIIITFFFAQKQFIQGIALTGIKG